MNKYILVDEDKWKNKLVDYYKECEYEDIAKNNKDTNEIVIVCNSYYAMKEWFYKDIRKEL